MYESISYITQYVTWIIGLLSLAVTFRCTTTLFMAYIDGDIQSAWIKTKKILFAGIIGVCASGLIIFLRGYYT